MCKKITSINGMLVCMTMNFKTIILFMVNILWTSYTFLNEERERERASLKVYLGFSGASLQARWLPRRTPDPLRSPFALLGKQ